MIHLLQSIWSNVTEVQETRIVVLGRSNHGKTALFERFKILLNDPTSAASEQRKALRQEAVAAAAAAASSSSSPLSRGKKGSMNNLDALKAHVAAQHHMAIEALSASGSLSKSGDGAVAAATTITSSSATANRRNSATGASVVHDEEEERKRRRKLLEEEELKGKFRYAASLPRFMSPTVGLNVGRGTCSVASEGGRTLKINALLWDVGGDAALRVLWHTYLVQAHGVVFVMDLTASPKETMDSVRLLHSLMLRPELSFAPFLIVGSKLDALKEEKQVQYAVPSTLTETASEGERNFVHATGLEFMRSLRLEDVAIRAMEAAQRHKEEEEQQRRKKKEKATTTTTIKEETAAAKNGSGRAAKSSQGAEKEPLRAGERAKSGGAGDDNDDDDDDDDDDVLDATDDNFLIAAEAMDIVHSVPQGSGVSGIAGHMFKTVVASAESIDGNDLLDALQWILSVSASSRARMAALEALNPDK